jgi:Transposase domain (DUF772)
VRWLENPYYQFFCGELSFCHKLPFDRSSLTHWRQRLGEEQLVALIQENLSVAHKTGVRRISRAPESRTPCKSRGACPASTRRRRQAPHRRESGNRRPRPAPALGMARMRLLACRQWQCEDRIKGPSISNRTPPHRQLPRSAVIPPRPWPGRRTRYRSAPDSG